ncbi:putative secreted protein with PEP-CTERM sorting signal [Prosthecobacter fusiformis]|uniref:Putative secreted protein with PEP-CTERM sorting signal n=1 Tax=Prosthecobacter fusiformis TaxID=48464 RepID=A0A4V3FES6_9BACT|nr:PEP-CTERM sorting domain-containing protein [Prosthecobacter fusiformis]TDU68183.1 putative secreted protein with PEP-CTERM sorting signal [Prosthecobacter fusiformis]
MVFSSQQNQPFAQPRKASKRALLAVFFCVLTCITGHAQTLNLISADITYSIQGDYTPSGSPAENINYGSTLNLLTQPNFEFSVSPWGGSMAVDFDFVGGSSTGFSFSFLGLSGFGIGNSASYDVSAATSFNYSILFELDSAALLDLGMSYTGYTNSMAYSPLSPGRDASVTFEYFGTNGWEVLASHDGTSYITQAVDFYQTVGPGTYRLSGTGLAHAGVLDANSSVNISPAPVPEPSALLLLGITGWLVVNRRSRSSKYHA